MNKYQEALENIKSIKVLECNEYVPVFDGSEESIILLQELVDRATPMNKYQEAWKRIKYTTNYDVRVFDDNDEEIKLIQELVDRATPKKPIGIVNYEECPVCKVVVLDKYCYECGKLLDWSKDEI